MKLTDEQLIELRAVPVGNASRNRLRAALRLAGLTQRAFAAGCGLDEPSVSDLVNGKYQDLRFSTVQRIAGFFGVPVDDIFPNLEVAA
jgi:transcriptional regulator with XRE-family HTH domain